MDDKQAKALGAYLRQQREAAGLSTRQLAAVAGVPDSTIVRFEQGAYGAPRPDKLARIADALNLSLADVYAMAEYVVPTDLPSPALYLRTKYRDLPDDAIEALSASVSRALKRHGIAPSTGPAPGEDEQPEPTPHRTRSTTSKKKGGGTT